MKQNKYHPGDVSLETIEELFNRQILSLTAKTSKLNSFDLQFSDKCLMRLCL